MKLSPSLLSADFVNLKDDILRLKKAGAADFLHIDVMDGHFVPNLTIGLPVISAIKKAFPDEILDVHLMIENAEKYIDEYCEAGADYLTVHLEAAPHLHRALSQIRKNGKKAGVALNPATSLHGLDYVLEELDMVLIMSVNPGFGGQSFIPKSLDKIRTLKRILMDSAPNVLISVDGGVTTQNAGEILRAGADVLVAGNALLKAPDLEGATRAFLKCFDEAKKERLLKN